MIRSLSIQNYRTFKNYQISSLGDVNLIVGNNNAGKSSFLEAVHLLTSDDVRASLFFILNERGEVASGISDPRFDPGRREFFQISQIFYERHLRPGQSIKINSSNTSPHNLEIILQSNYREKLREDAQPSLFEADDLDEDEQIDSLVFKSDKDFPGSQHPRLRITEDGHLLDNRPYSVRRILQPKGNSKFLTTNYIGYDELAVLWDKITLTPKEDKVIKALQILEPTVDRISFTSSQTTNSGILLRLRSEPVPLPLGSMGDGMRRIMAIIASLVSVDNGTLLIDEIDTGLHHGALVNMWRLVLETAARQQAQVFATTHSWDCVRAFQQALDEVETTITGKLIRLEKSGDSVNSILYSSSELDIAIEQNIEVR